MLRHQRRPPVLLARSLARAAVLVAVLALCPRPAAAQTDMAAAGKAFSQAQAAELREEWKKAASLYELAVRIAPSPEAMRGALRARRKAGDDAKAATWALELQRKHPTDGPSRQLATETLDELRAELTKLQVGCTPSPCTLEIDGQAVGTEALSTHRLFVAPGSHQLTAGFGSRRTEPQGLEAQAGGDAELSFEEPAAPSADSTAASNDANDDTYAAVDQPATTSPAGADAAGGGGLAPAWAISGMVITAGLAGVTIWSGLDTRSAADDYQQAPTEQGYQDGTGRELRTNVLIGATAAVGVATLAITIFATDWGSSAEPDAAAAVLPVIAPGQLGASWQTRF